MKIWIVGQDGMLGKALIKKAKKLDIEYVATSRSDVDITEQDSIVTFLKNHLVTHIINAAAYTAVDLAELDEKKAYKVNVDGIANLAKVAKLKKIKLLHFSTDYVFNGNETSSYKEDMICDPLSIYGKTKHLGEKALLNELPTACIIRTSWLFGGEGAHFVKTMQNLMKTRPVLHVIADQKGKPTHVDDLAGASFEMLEHSGVFHFAGKEQTTWYDWANHILDVLKLTSSDIVCEKIVPITSEEYAKGAIRPKNSVLNTEKIEKLLSVKPKSFKETTCVI